MCLAPVIQPEGPAPQGQESLAQGLYVFCAGHTARRSQDSSAQGLPWVSQQNVLCPEGARDIEPVRGPVGADTRHTMPLQGLLRWGEVHPG